MRSSSSVLALTLLPFALFLAACGSDTEQRASTGALTGIGVGAVVGGPIGAAVGGVVGGVGGAAAPEGADQVAHAAINKEKSAGQQALNGAGLGPELVSLATGFVAAGRGGAARAAARRPLSRQDRRHRGA